MSLRTWISFCSRFRSSMSPASRVAASPSTAAIAFRTSSGGIVEVLTTFSSPLMSTAPCSATAAEISSNVARITLSSRLSLMRYL